MTHDPTATHSDRAEFDAYATSYRDEVTRSIGFTGVDADYFTRVKADYLTDILARELGAPERVRLLDIGCGVGVMHGRLAPRVASLAGVDVSAPCVAEAAAAHPHVAYRSYDGLSLPFDDGSFDAAVTTCVIHHVPPAQWPSFAAEMRRVLRPGGIGVIFEHNPFNPLTRRAVSNCAFDEHAVLLSGRTAVRLLGGAGFAAPRKRAILSIPSFGPMTRKADLALGRLGLGAQYVAYGRAP